MQTQANTADTRPLLHMASGVNADPRPQSHSTQPDPHTFHDAQPHPGAQTPAHVSCGLKAPLELAFFMPDTVHALPLVPFT